MKRRYEKPMVAVERYALTQSIAACAGIKIGFETQECIRNDPHSTDTMLNLMNQMNGFLSKPNCGLVLIGDKYDSICYHTNINAAFTS